MIDTIKFKVLVNNEIFNKLKKLSKERVCVNHESKIVEYDYISSQINVGSFSRKVSISCSSEGFAYIEFSVPKVIFGHNVLLINANQVIEGTRIIYEDLNKITGGFPPYKDKWEIIKLDLCYSWKFNNDDQADKILKVLKSFKYLEFKKHVYKTSVMFVGSAYTLKYYLKYPEVLAHDFKELIKLGKSDLAYKAQNLASHVLRCEVSLRSNQLKFLYGDNLTLDRLFSYNLVDQLKIYHKKLIKMDTITTGIAEVSRLLNLKYGVKKGGRLFIFYRSYTSENPLDNQIIKDSYSYWQIWRNLKLIKDAGVGIVMEDNKFNLDLDIPSNLEVNKVVAGAQARQLH